MSIEETSIPRALKSTAQPSVFRVDSVQTKEFSLARLGEAENCLQSNALPRAAPDARVMIYLTLLLDAPRARMDDESISTCAHP